jgi:hypothetical protein
MQIIIRPRSAPFTRAALVLIVLGSCLLTASTWLVFSHTWDEPEHLAAGLELLDRGTADLSREPLPPLQLLPPVRRVSGWVAITALAREHDDAGYAWLDGYPPRERVGKTIDLYYIP